MIIRHPRGDAFAHGVPVLHAVSGWFIDRTRVGAEAVAEVAASRASLFQIIPKPSAGGDGASSVLATPTFREECR